jgi:ribosomal protein L33
MDRPSPAQFPVSHHFFKKSRCQAKLLCSHAKPTASGVDENYDEEGDNHQERLELCAMSVSQLRVGSREQTVSRGSVNGVGVLGILSKESERQRVSLYSTVKWCRQKRTRVQLKMYCSEFHE